MSTITIRVNCLLVHGWGMNHTVWQPLIERMPSWIDCHAIDLPGHGLRHNESLTDLSQLADDLHRQCEKRQGSDKPLVVIGWSLGALACLQMAIESNDKVLADALLLVSGTPCFVAQDDWQSGVDVKIFEQFAESLKADFSGTIRRFLSLQVKGSESGRQILRRLREKILQQAQPDTQSLDAGLEILKATDLRKQLAKIQLPVSWALGAQDGLIKVNLADDLHRLMPAAEVRLYSKAGHAPFLSDTGEFAQQLVKFIQSRVVPVSTDP